MKNLITEENLSYFLKSATVADIEVFFNSIILMNKHIDRDKKQKKNYIVRLFDTAQENVPSYLVASNAVGLEAIRVITAKHKIIDGGTESDSSKYFSFYSE